VSRARRPNRLRRSSALLVAVLVGAGLAPAIATGSVAAVDDPANALDRPIVDAAFVDRGPDQPPDVLTLAFESPQPLVAKLALLRRDARWAVHSERDLDLPPGFDGFSVWLTQLSPNRFVVVAQTNDGTSQLRLIAVDATDLGAITVGAPLDLPFAPYGAGAADVDADGIPEFIVAGSTGGQNSDCQRANVAVLSTDGTLGLREQHGVVQVTTGTKRPIAYFSGMALGQWDDRPGVDLLVNGYECAADQQLPDGDAHHLMAIRLADMATINDLPTSPVDANVAVPSGNPPAVIDVDHDGRNEAVVTTSVGFRVIDPEDGWKVTPFGRLSEAMIAAIHGSDLGAGPSLVFLRHTGDDSRDGVAVTRLRRVDGTIRIEDAGARLLPWVTGTTLDSAIAYLRDSTWPDQPAGSVIDVDEDGCPDLLVPRVTIGCIGTGELQPAPAWTATRPLAALDTGSGRSILVADGLDWYPGSSGPTAPSPAAVHPPGSWRTAMTVRFVLAEVPLDGATIPVPTVSAPTVDRASTQDGQVEVERPAGTRLLMRVHGYGDAGPGVGDDRLLTSDGFLLTEGRDNEFAGPAMYIGLNAVPPVMTGFGSGGGTEVLDLRTTSNGSETGPVSRWVVTFAALDPSGTLSTPVQRTAVIDNEAPPLRVDVPFTSAPWPLTGALHGVSEPGATITLVGGSIVTAGSDGTFDVPAQLAPWPQTLDLTARDVAGNQTASRVSVMGGVDVRGLPWPAIGVVLVLVAVFLSSIRGVRGGPRQVRPIAVDVDDENATVIEELSVGRIDRRD
jgi:hypothetical protein